MKKMMLAAMVGLGLLGMRAEVQAASGAALSARAYVQDGLVGMLDGIENAGWGVHNASATSWKDLAGTIGDFAVDSCAQFQADGLKKISAGVMAGVGSGASKPNNLKTIEAAVSGANSVLPNATDYIIPVYVDRNQYIAFNWNGSTRQMSFDSIGNGNGWRTSETPDAVTYSVAYTPFSKANGFYVNAAHPDGYAFSDSYGDDLGTTAIHLGARELSSSRIDTKAYNFTVNALRFYTRELTEDEVKQNYLIDAYRFRGEIPFATADYKADETGKQLLCRFTAKGAKGIKVTVNGEKAGEKWFKAGEVVTLTATPFAGAIFKGWKGTVEGYDAEDLKSLSIAVTVDRALDLIADGECNSDILQSDDVSPLSAKAYVQDGLVGFLDGFENAGWNKHSAAATSWKDLAGTIGDFAVDASCAQFLANGLKKIDAGVMAGVGSGSSKPNNIKTIEAAVSDANKVQPNSTDYIIPVYIDRNQYIAFNWNGTTRQMSFDSVGNGNGWRTSETPDAMTYSVIYNPLVAMKDFFVDATKPAGSSFSDTYGDDLGTTAIHLGSRELSSSRIDTKAHNFTLNALRFYTRELTLDEIKQNTVVDAYRYRGEIPFDTADYKAIDAERTELACRVQATGTAGVKVLFDGEAAGSKWVDVGDIVTLTAKPYNGVTFTGWTGDTDMIVEGDASSATITVYVSRALSLTAEGIDESGIFPATGVSPLSARAYVQDGLVGLLDGFENAGWNQHNAAATSWKDLAGTIGDFAVNPLCGEFQADGLKKAAVSYHTDDYRGLLAVLSSTAAECKNIVTIESALTGLNSVGGGYVIPVSLGANQYMVFRLVGSERRLYFDSDLSTYKSGWSTTELPDAMTCSAFYEPLVRSTGFYVNAKKPSGYVAADNYPDEGSNPYAIKLGGRYMEGRSGGEHSCVGYIVNSLRFYNRQLTLAEVEDNTVVDAYRFRGEIPFDTANYKAADGERTELACRVQAMASAGVEVMLDGEGASAKWLKLGDFVTLRAKAYNGVKFTGWKGDIDTIVEGDAASEEITVFVNRALSLKATGVDESGKLPTEGVSLLSAKAYVQDGLVGLLDGFENAGWNKHDAAATSWKDLAGTIGDFAVNGGCCAFMADGLKKVSVSDRSDSFYGVMAKCSSRPTVADRPSDIATIETALSGMNDENAKGYLIPVFMGGNNYFAFQTKSESNRTMVFDNNSPDNGWQTSEVVDALTCSVLYNVPVIGEKNSKKDFFINASKPTGSLFGDTFGDKVANPCAIKLGAREIDYGSTEHSCHGFTINAVRFYTRELTLDEIKQNTVVDAYRYRGTVPFDTVNYKAANAERTELLCRVQATGVAGIKVDVDGEAGSKWFGLGKFVTLKANVPNGTTFTGWTGDTDMIMEGSVSSETITVYVNRALSIVANGEHSEVAVAKDLEITEDLYCKGIVFGGAYRISSANGAKVVIDENGTGITFSGATGTATIDCPIVIGETGAKQAIAVADGAKLVINGAVGGDAALDLSGDVQFLGGGDAKGDWNLLSGSLTLSGVFTDKTGTITATPEGPLTLIGADISKLVALGGENKTIPATTAVGTEAQKANFLRGGLRDNGPSWMSWYLQIAEKTELTIEGAITSAASITSYMAVTGGGTLKLGVDTLASFCPTFYVARIEFLKAPTSYSAMRDAVLSKNMRLVAGCENAFALTSWEAKGIIDLNGMNQTMGRFAYPCEYNGDGSISTFTSLSAKVHSDEPATLTLAFDNATGSGSNTGKGVFGGQFTGKASFVKTGDQDLGLAGESTAVGSLTVAEGLVEFVKDLAYGGSAYTGSWRSCKVAMVKAGGVLALDHSEAFGAGTRLVVENGGKVRLAAGVRQRVRSLTLPTGKAKFGTYGSPSSSADNKLDCFEGEGVVEILGGTMMFVK